MSGRSNKFVRLIDGPSSVERCECLKILKVLLKTDLIRQGVRLQTKNLHERSKQHQTSNAPPPTKPSSLLVSGLVSSHLDVLVQARKPSKKERTRQEVINFLG